MFMRTQWILQTCMRCHSSCICCVTVSHWIFRTSPPQFCTPTFSFKLLFHQHLDDELSSRTALSVAAAPSAKTCSQRALEALRALPSGQYHPLQPVGEFNSTPWLVTASDELACAARSGLRVHLPMRGVFEGMPRKPRIYREPERRRQLQYIPL